MQSTSRLLPLLLSLPLALTSGSLISCTSDSSGNAGNCSNGACEEGASTQVQQLEFSRYLESETGEITLELEAFLASGAGPYDSLDANLWIVDEGANPDRDPARIFSVPLKFDSEGSGGFRSELVIAPERFKGWKRMQVQILKTSDQSELAVVDETFAFAVGNRGAERASLDQLGFETGELVAVLSQGADIRASSGDVLQAELWIPSPTEDPTVEKHTIELRYDSDSVGAYVKSKIELPSFLDSWSNLNIRVFGNLADGVAVNETFAFSTEEIAGTQVHSPRGERVARVSVGQSSFSGDSIDLQLNDRANLLAAQGDLLDAVLWSADAADSSSSVTCRLRYDAEAIGGYIGTCPRSRAEFDTGSDIYMLIRGELSDGWKVYENFKFVAGEELATRRLVRSLD